MTDQAQLRDVLELRSEIVHPRDAPTGGATFVGLEHIQSGTGRRTGSTPIRLESLTGRKARFYAGDIVYGYLRPYLNKVWLADSDGYCSVDQYVFKVRANADPRYVASFMRSPHYLERAPVDITPGQLPRIRTDEVLSVVLPLPSLNEQRAIAARLTTQLARAAQITQGLEGGRLACDELVEGALRGSLRERAEETDLSKCLVEVTKGVGSSWRQYPVLGSTRGGVALAKDPVGKYPERYKLVEPGTIFYNPMRILIGSISYLEHGQESGITSPDYVVFRTRREALDDRWFYQWMRSWRGIAMIRSLARGAVRERMLFRRLAPARISLPPIAVQREASAIIERALGVRTKIDTQVNVANLLPASLLQEAFSDT